MSAADPRPRAAPRALLVAWALAMAALAALKAAPLTFVDPDVWHQISLAREVFRAGRVPSVDVFAYTPTVRPLVHHEWGAGVLWLAVAQRLGGAGFLLLKYALVGATLALAVRSARRRGADALTLIALAPPAILAAHYAFTTIRAQVLSLLCVAALMNVLAAEEAGRPRLLALWLVVHVAWLNAHAGFVVGLGFLGLSAVERFARREPFARLAAATAAAAALVLVNPWGAAYPRYLAHGLFMARPGVPEWDPLWRPLRVGDLGVWAAMLGLAAYAVASRGLRACRGVSLVAVSLVAALQHHRNLSPLAVAWFSLVPAWVAGTPLVAALDRFVAPRARLLTALGALVGAVLFAGAMLQRPWSLTMPTDRESNSEGLPTYPVGALDYLRAVNFRGNLMTPFVEGGYVMWRMHPHGVRVSYDGRFEAAYLPSVVRDHGVFYGALAGWQGVLRRYPTDAVLVPRRDPIVVPMQSARGWRMAYGDDLYIVFAAERLALPFVDCRGCAVHPAFP